MEEAVQEFRALGKPIAAQRAEEEIKRLKQGRQSALEKEGTGTLLASLDQDLGEGRRYVFVNNRIVPFDILHQTNSVDWEFKLGMVKEIKKNSAMLERGGIDFNADKINLQIQNAGEGIKFHIDPAMLKQLQNAPGFVPVIINIQPLKSLPEFLGIREKGIRETAGNSQGMG